MKLRKFYPSQVLRKLDGQAVAGLCASDLAVLNIGIRRARKAGVVISVTNGVVAVHCAGRVGKMMMADLKEVMSRQFAGATKEQAEAVIANANNRIFLKIEEETRVFIDPKRDPSIRERLFEVCRAIGKEDMALVL